MVRIIPWNLPPVAGGSEGGYTPQPTPEPPEPEEYIDIDNILIDRGASHPNEATFTVDSVDKKKLTGFATAGAYLSGITAVNLIGVSSITIVLSVKYTASITGTVNISIDPLNLNAMTFISGTLTGNSAGTTATLSILQYDLYVYNGNGEIIQTDSVEVTP